MNKLPLPKNFMRIKRFFFYAVVSLAFLSIYNCAKAKKNQTQALLSEKVALVNTSSFLGANAYKVPHDVLNPADSSQVALSSFAWREFIALNWPSSYNTTTYTRGEPDATKTVADFLSAKNTGQLVWQTYRHRVEMYPKDSSKFNPNFNSAPQYFYEVDGQSSIKSLNPNNTTDLRNITTVFNNLDETSEINLCTLFVDGDPDAPGADVYAQYKDSIASGLPGAPRRMIYEAKGNKEMFQYIKNHHLYDTIVRGKKIAYTDNAIKNNGAGAVYPCPEPNKMICFPFGEVGGSEGSIEVKATWKPLTLSEYNSGRYLTAPIIYYREGKPGVVPNDKKTYYRIVPATPTYQKIGNDSTLVSLPYGLVGLHIIHKTKTFPSYVFATFEQVDNLNETVDHNTLFYYNRNSNPNVNPDKQYAFRAVDISNQTDSINKVVQQEIRSLNPSSVWQYYQLIGVQGHPQNNANSSDYLLSNVMTETNQTLRNFSGTLNANGTFDPTKINLYQGDKVFVQGGCKGCHGNAQKADFSFITLNAPFEGQPDFINQPLLLEGQ